MKSILAISFLLAVNLIAAQNYCSKHKSAHASITMEHQRKTSALLPHISHELKYDVKFVHLDLNLERTNKYVQGGVKTIAKVIAPSLDTFQTLLHQNHTIDSIRFNGALISHIRVDSMIKIKPASPLSANSIFTVVIYYKGNAPTGGAAIGSGYSNGTSGAWGNQVSWSLSEAIVAYHWWPCKQILTDKIDSSWVSVITDSTNKVGSNGILKNVSVIGNKKKYEWRSRIPIAYYLISVAIAKYKEYNFYAKPQFLTNDSIFIQNYIYDNAINNNTWINSQKVQLNKMKQVMEFLCEKFGMYPFYKEKYGHCMAPFGGGMEHQTMTSLGFFDYYIDAHELGHQWWGDQVTCKSWGDIWINEGFASYTEHLVAQYLDNANYMTNLNSAHNNVMSQTGGSIFFTDTLNSNRVFDGRLTYDKGGAILHTLRFVTNNDSLWFQTLRSFQNTYKNSTAATTDFMNHYQTQTGIDPTQFFNQWYYGEGYPTFTVKYFQSGTAFYLRSTQSTSKPTSVALFITPMEYKLSRTGAADTTIRVLHGNTTENYTLTINGTVTAVSCDPNNWVINKVVGPTLDPTLVGLEETAGLSSMIDIGPNPFTSALQIRNTTGLELKLKVLDIKGSCVYEGAAGSSSSIDLGHLSRGNYLLQVMDQNSELLEVKKLIKQ